MVSLAGIFNLFKDRDMDCADVRKLSSDYLEEDLSLSQLEKFRTHISGCGPCKSFVDRLASVIVMLAEMSRAQPTTNLKSSIFERTTREEQGGDSTK